MDGTKKSTAPSNRSPIGDAVWVVYHGQWGDTIGSPRVVKRWESCVEAERCAAREIDASGPFRERLASQGKKAPRATQWAKAINPGRR